MPKKLLRRIVPQGKFQADRPGLRWLGPLLQDPYLFHLNRRSVSLAFFVGLLCAFLPLPGQMLLAALLALLVRANLLISTALVWVSNPLTMPPLFYLCYRLGSHLLGSPPLDLHFHMEWHWLAQQSKIFFAPLLLGCLVTGVVLGAVSCLIIRGLWRWNVTRSWNARHRRRLQSKRSEQEKLR